MIVAGSLRQLPYSLRVDGRQTYIVGYAFTPTGVEEPTVGNDWYPLDLDVYDNQEHASVDAYIASEEGQATLQGCGVSALVPLETAVARLADNGINITVRQGLYVRSNTGGEYGLVVDKTGSAVYFTGGSTNYVLKFDVMNPNVLSPTDENNVTVAELVQSYGLGTQLPESPHDGSVYNIDGISYTVREIGDAITLTPAPSAWE